MKIIIIGGNGKQGQFLVKEALERGHEVAVVARSGKVPDSRADLIAKDLFDLTYEDLKNSDVVLDAFGVWEPEKLVLHETSLKHLADLLSGKPQRLIVVGGAGSLYIDPDHQILLKDSKDFPDSYKPVANAMGKAFDELKKREDVRWTYVSPPADFSVDRPKTGSYRIGGDELLVNSKGESVIGYADYAGALLDEAEKGEYIKKRITVVEK